MCGGHALYSRPKHDIDLVPSANFECLSGFCWFCLLPTDPITILLDLKMSLDDVPLGLSLQQQAPFRFSCSRLWMQNIPEVGLTPANLGRIIDTNVRHSKHQTRLTVTHLTLQALELPMPCAYCVQCLKHIWYSRGLHILSWMILLCRKMSACLAHW